MINKSKEAPFKFVSILIALLVNGLGLWELLLPSNFLGLRVGITAGVVLPVSALVLFFNRPRLTKRQVMYLWLILFQAILFFVLLDWQTEQNSLHKALLFLLLSVIPSVLVLFNFNKSINSIEVFLTFICLFSFLPVIRMLLIGISFPQYWSGYGAWYLRNRGIDVIGFSRSIGVGMLILTYKFSQRPKTRILLLLVIVAMGVLQFFLRERGPIYITLGIILLLTILLIKHQYRFFVGAIGLVALLIVILYIGVLDSRFSMSSIQNDPRGIIYDRSMGLFFENPILGVGTASFSIPELEQYDQRVYSHNILLEIMVENGLVGLLIFLLTIAVIIATIFRNKDKLTHPLVKVLLILFCYAFFQAQVSGDVTNNYLIWVFGSSLMGYYGNFQFLSIPQKV
jgi:O-antigen ligase